MDVNTTVAVCTHGEDRWVEMAQRAILSAHAQAPTFHVHLPDGTLAEARNRALSEVDTEWIVFLDGDDELEPGYVDALAAGSADLRSPSVRYVRGAHEQPPYVPRVAGHNHACTAECIASGDGNWLVIGTYARTQLLRDVGGFREWPCYEDFDLWMRACRAGATVETIPAAVYRAHVDPRSRNRSPDIHFRNQVHHDIVAQIRTEEAA